MPNAPLTLLGRILISAVFLLAGAAKLADSTANADYFSTVGVPVPGLMVWVVGIFEILAAAAIIAGFRTRLAAAALALFCVATALIAHFDPADQIQMAAFLKNLALAGGFLVLIACGPGKWSLDGRQV